MLGPDSVGLDRPGIEMICKTLQMIHCVFWVEAISEWNGIPSITGEITWRIPSVSLRLVEVSSQSIVFLYEYKKNISKTQQYLEAQARYSVETHFSLSVML
jgi:hypothetical protein